MKERLGRVGRALWSRKRSLAVVFVFSALVGELVVQHSVLTQFASSLGVLTENNARLTQEMSAQNVLLAQKDQAIEQLSDQLNQAIALLKTSIPVKNVVWCTGMAVQEIPQEVADLTRLTFMYVSDLPTEAPVEGICVDFFSYLYSAPRGEIYVLATRSFTGGAAERLIVYFEEVPGNPGNFRVAGHYDVILRQWVPAS